MPACFFLHNNNVQLVSTLQENCNKKESFGEEETAQSLLSLHEEQQQELECQKNYNFKRDWKQLQYAETSFYIVWA